MKERQPTEHGERLVTITDEHWIRFIGPVVIAAMLLLVSLLLFVLAGLSSHHYMWLSHVTFIAGMLLFTFTLHWFFMILIGDSLDCIIITNRRLLRMQYRPLFHDDVLEISFVKMKTVDAQKIGFLQNVLRYGTLYFETKLASVPYVRHPNHVAKIIQATMNGEEL